VEEEEVISFKSIVDLRNPIPFYPLKEKHGTFDILIFVKGEASREI